MKHTTYGGPTNINGHCKKKKVVQVPWQPGFTLLCQLA